MFEARLLQGNVLKKLLEAIKDLVTEANFDCSAAGMTLQAMDSSHVSLVALHLRAAAFELYRADRNISLGVNLGSMAKILKCSSLDDIITIKAEDSGDSIEFMFESPKNDRNSHFSMKLMVSHTIDQTCTLLFVCQSTHLVNFYMVNSPKARLVCVELNPGPQCISCHRDFCVNDNNATRGASEVPGFCSIQCSAHDNCNPSKRRKTTSNASPMSSRVHHLELEDVSVEGDITTEDNTIPVNAICDIGQHCLRDLIHQTQSRYHVQNTPEASRFDMWLTRVPKSGVGTLTRRGIPIQIKTTLNTSKSWQTQHAGGSKLAKGRDQPPWHVYQGGLLAKVTLDLSIATLLLPYWQSAKNTLEPKGFPSLTLAQHALNRYHLLPFNRPTVSAEEVARSLHIDAANLSPPFAVTLPPYVMKKYWTADGVNSSLLERFNSINCWELSPTIAAVLGTLDKVFDDNYRQFTPMTFNECRLLSGRTHATEHFGHGLLQVLMQQLSVGLFQWCRAGVGPDFLLDGCPVEAKSVNSGLPAGGWYPKDWTNLRNGRVRCLFAHRLHLDPLEDGSHLDLVVIPWSAISNSLWIRQPHDEPSMPFTGSIDVNGCTSIKEEDVAPFRMRITDADFVPRIKKILRSCCPASDQHMEKVRMMVEPSWSQLDSPDVCMPFVFLHPTHDDLTGSSLSSDKAIKKIVAKAQAGFLANVDRVSSRPTAWTYRNDDGSVWTIPSAHGTTDAYKAAQRLLYPESDRWPKKSADSPDLLFCPCPKPLKGSSEMIDPTNQDLHWHTSRLGLETCLVQITPGVSCKIGTAAYAWYNIPKGGGIYTPTTNAGVISKWRKRQATTPL